MKTKEQVQTEIKFGSVFTLEEFADLVCADCINEYDGIGYFHDGEKETNIYVFNPNLTIKEMEQYPYICWYNK